MHDVCQLIGVEVVNEKKNNKTVYMFNFTYLVLLLKQ